MKTSILCYSLTGHIREMAEVVAAGCEVKLFPLDAIDKELFSVAELPEKKA